MLTPRQMQVAELVSRGFTDKQISRLLNCSVRTVEVHVAEVCRYIPPSEGRNTRVRLTLWYLGIEDSDRLTT